MTYDRREAKLPRWAQEQLSNARRDAAEARRKLAEHVDTRDQTRIWTGGYDNRIYMPDRGSRGWVHFDPHGDDDHFHDIQIGIDGENQRIEVMGGNTLTVTMVSSNHFYIRTER